MVSTFNDRSIPSLVGRLVHPRGKKLLALPKRIVPKIRFGLAPDAGETINSSLNHRSRPSLVERLVHPRGRKLFALAKRVVAQSFSTIALTTCRAIDQPFGQEPTHTHKSYELQLINQ